MIPQYLVAVVLMLNLFDKPGVTFGNIEVTTQDNFYTVSLMVFLILSVYLGIKIIDRYFL